jgi:hypothetical protein
MNVCPYCHRANCQLEKARRARSLTLESSPSFDSPFTPEQIGKLEELYLSESPSRKLSTYRDMVAPLALEGAPVDASFITTEEPRMTSGGLLEPATDHWFSLENQESRLANGLRRPDAMPSEQEEQLRQLFLSKPAPKQPQRKFSREQLRALGWLSEQNDTLELSPDRYAKGGLIIPD